MSSQGHDATIAKWTRKKERNQEASEQATRDTKEALAKAMREESTRQNIRQEVLDARKSGARPHTQSGYGDDGEIIDGWTRPWERE